MKYGARFTWLALCLALVPPAKGANGDPLWWTIETNGWIGVTEVQAVPTNASFAFGLGTNNSIQGTQAVNLSLTRMGYDDSGNGIRVGKSFYGTKQLRLAYPNNALNDATTNGANGTHIRLAQSEYVYQSDSNVLVSVLANWYSNNNAVVGLAVSNLSTKPYPAAVAFWANYHWRRITNSTVRLEIVAVHASAQQGRPLRTVRFVGQDVHSHAQTNFIGWAIANLEVTTGVYTCLYAIDMDCSGFTAGDQIRFDFTCYPWEGDSGAATSTFDEANHWPTPYYCSVTNLYDPNYAYASSNQTWAIVDKANLTGTASDANGTAMTNVLNQASLPVCFASINGALLAINGTNGALYNHSDVGAGQLYLLAYTNYNCPEGSGNYGGIPKTWCTVSPYPTCSVDQVIIATNSGNSHICGLDRFYGLTFSNYWKNDNIGCYYRSQALLLDTCKVAIDTGDTVGTKLTVGREVTNAMAFHCTIIEMRNGSSIGFGPQGSNPGGWSILRDCVLNGTGVNQAWVIIGCARTTTNGTAHSNHFLQTFAASQSAASLVGSGFWGFNDFRNLWWSTGTPCIDIGSGNTLNGFALIQNVFEDVGGVNQPLMRLCGDSDTSNTTNVLAWNNLLQAGAWFNYAYNDRAGVQLNMDKWSMLNNVADSWNIKDDIFATNGSNTFNWAVVFGVGMRGNIDLMTTNVGIHSNPNDFFGLNGSQVPTSQQHTTNWPAFVKRTAYDGAANGVGGGDYRWQSSSPLMGLQTAWVLPFDLAGNRRSASDPPGPYCVANPRRGAGFF